MLGKLMKYELKATARVFLPLYGALILVSIISRIFMNFRFELPSTISTVISSIMIVAVCVITLVLTFQRFRTNLLSREGYLMFTLPVSTDSLIISKLLISALWFIVSAVVVLIAIVVMAMSQFSLIEFLDEAAAALRSIHLEQYHLYLYIGEMIVACIASLLSGILMIYACMALSLFANKNRSLLTFGAFIGFSIIGQVIGSIFFVAFDKYDLSNILSRFTDTGLVHTVFLSMIIVNLIVGGVFYFITRYMLVNKLNLE